MNIPAKYTSSLILLLSSTIPLWCQQASLGGLIKDRLDESPIPAADVLVNGKPAGITGTDGRYLVSGLKLGAKVNVAYKKQGYGARIEDVMLEHSRTDKDVTLFKDTTDVAYWSAWSLKLRMLAEKEGSSSRYREEWEDVESAGLSPEAKAVAALRLASVMPAKANSSRDLVASQTVTGCMQKGDEAGEFIIRGEDGKTWGLRSKSVKLSEHIGHRVTVTGSTAHETKAEEKKEGQVQNAGSRAEYADLDVTSMKMVSDTCSK